MWTTLRTIPSSTNCEGVSLVSIPHHPNWFTFAREPCLSNNYPRVIIYINVRLSSFYFSLWKDIINYKDILLASFFNDNIIFWIMNVYSDSSHSALKYLKNTEVNIMNLLIMTGDFNIRDSIWNLSFPHHSAISNNLMIIADFYNWDLSIPTHWVPTRYSDTTGEANSVINLMFLQSGSMELNNHSIYPDWQLSLDHAPLTITIPIAEENIISSKFSIAKNSNEEESFINDILYAIKNINVDNLSDSSKLEVVTNTLASKIKNAWRANSKWVNITRQSKSWWNKECSIALSNYRTTQILENWKTFKSKVKTTKQLFFNIKIQEIANKKRGPWKLMNWVNKHKLSAIKAIKYNNQQCLDINDLWNILHSIFNTALYHQVDVKILNEILEKLTFPWPSFSKEEFRITIANYNNVSAPGPDKLL